MQRKRALLCNPIGVLPNRWLGGNQEERLRGRVCVSPPKPSQLGPVYLPACPACLPACLL